jgi:uncharacterized cupin superfamily protein
MGDYTLKSYNMEEAGILQSLATDLGLEAVGISLSQMPPGMGYPFFHAHKEQEEVFICLKGSGTILVGDDEITMKTGDFLRISADVPRAVGNRTSEPCTFLMLGAMPPQKFKSEEGMFVISDGIEMQDRICDWTVTDGGQ